MATCRDCERECRCGSEASDSYVGMIPGAGWRWSEVFEERGGRLWVEDARVVAFVMDQFGDVNPIVDQGGLTWVDSGGSRGHLWHEDEEPSHAERTEWIEREKARLEKVRAARGKA